MISAIYNWLFPKLVLRPCEISKEDGAFTVFDNGRKHWILRSDDDVFHMRCLYFIDHPLVNKRRQSIVSPPLHIHRTQTEIFDVRRGAIGYILNGKEGKLVAPATVTIPNGVPHTFWMEPHEGEDTILDVIIFNPGRGVEEEWMTNAYGYLESCRLSNVMPSIIQMYTLFHEGDGDLCLFAFAPNWVNHWLTVFIGGVLGPMFGYKSRYEELAVPTYESGHPGAPRLRDDADAKQRSHSPQSLAR